MALEGICGVDRWPFMRRFDHLQTEWQKEQVREATSNFENPYALMAPPFEDPVENLPKILAHCGVKMDFAHGTTTLGFRYQGGVVLCADSRATSGQYIGSQTMKKIVELNDYMLGTLAGGAADCVYWDRVLARDSRLHELRFKRRLSVDAAARMIVNISAEYKGMGLVMGMMLAGYDDEGPKLIYVDSEGMRCHGNVFAVGSGSPYALGVLDTGHRFTMTDQEAFDLARRAIYHATSKDAYSGGIVRLYHINEKGWRNVSNTDCSELYNVYCKDDHSCDDAGLGDAGCCIHEVPCASGCQQKKEVTENEVSVQVAAVTQEGN
ncbi:proteasome subunit beta type-5 [Drosophila pseudoobscura]|uniref:proteasome endopeptidase complex n=1 Tax=Drosophila pseudoobscura pseudoobscura TaxID=46245 RepID=A0A6I8USV9_DROPS|nr:proteasome subunit beta type-5 [Drosophila pseudoobscura]